MIRLHGPRFWALASIFIGFAIAYPFLRKPTPRASQARAKPDPDLGFDGAPAYASLESFASRETDPSAPKVAQADLASSSISFGDVGQQAFESVPDIRQLPAELPEWVRPASGLDQLLADSHRDEHSAPTLRRLEEPKPWIEQRESRSVSTAGKRASPETPALARMQNEQMRSPFDRDESSYGSNFGGQQSDLQAREPPQIRDLLADSMWPDQGFVTRGWKDPHSSVATNQNALSHVDSTKVRTSNSQTVVRAPAITREGFARGPGSLTSVRPWQGSGPDDPKLPREENAQQTQRKRRFIYQPGYNPDDQ
ncbi:MAG: hypothetical protein ACE361_04105 [Aureliella sp.]